MRQFQVNFWYFIMKRADCLIYISEYSLCQYHCSPSPSFHRPRWNVRLVWSAWTQPWLIWLSSDIFLSFWCVFHIYHRWWSATLTVRQKVTKHLCGSQIAKSRWGKLETLLSSQLYTQNICDGKLCDWASWDSSIFHSSHTECLHDIGDDFSEK